MGWAALGCLAVALSAILGFFLASFGALLLCKLLIADPMEAGMIGLHLAAPAGLMGAIIGPILVSYAATRSRPKQPASDPEVCKLRNRQKKSPAGLGGPDGAF